MKKLRSISLAIAVAALATPGHALAVDTFVDPDTGSDANNCTQAAPGGAGLGPCATVAGGVAKAISGGTVRIDRGDTFLQSVALSGGVSLLGQEFEGSDVGPAVIDGTGGSGVFVSGGETAGTVRGLSLRGDSQGVSSAGTLARVTQNVFDEPTPGTGGIFLGAGSTLVDGNTFTGDGISNETGIFLGDGSATVAGNSFSGFHVAIFISGSGGSAPTSTPTVTSNTITAPHPVMSTAGSGIAAFSGSDATVVGNTVSGPEGGVSLGITVNGFSEPATTGMTLRRNQVRGGFANGVDVRDTGLAVSLDSDLVTGATTGFFFLDQGGPSGQANVTATNITAFGNGTDISTGLNSLTLDSSIVGDPIADASATCAISFSRGPTTSGGPCDTFQTTADPLFVDFVGGNLHLQPSSQLIDAGNPAAPLAGALDVDGGPRALDATPACSGNVDRRDIGADEFSPVQPDCAPPAQTVSPPKKKKCKKGRKLKKGKCVKKKRKKRR